MAKYLIIGCGDIGSQVGKALAINGHEVIGWKRNPPNLHSNNFQYRQVQYQQVQHKQVQYQQVDVSQPTALGTFDCNVDQVIYIITPDGRDEQAYRKVFETGVNNVLNLFSAKNPNATFIFVSSSRVYGQHTGEWVDENSETTPKDIQGEILLAAERRFLNHHPKNTVIRFSGIYGRLPSRFIDKIKKDTDVQYDPPYYTNRIHYTDCISFLTFLAHLKNTDKHIDSIYIATDDAPAPLWEVACWLRNALQLPPPRQSTQATTQQNKRLSNKRLKALGYELLVKTYREGYTPLH